MGKKLVIVESPAKARTIGSMLDDSYIVMSSVGHVRDLPRTRFGVDVSNNFTPEYVTISGKQGVIEKIKKASRDVEEIYLAADPDREGEAICWHLAHYLDASKTAIHRVLYYEITPHAIRSGLQNPMLINLSKVNAQQARRVLDRIVGYRLSPLLWKKVRRGLSAGRVQSVALKLICDREREIQAFLPKEYWILKAHVAGDSPPSFIAAYAGSHQKRIKLADQASTDAVIHSVSGRPFVVTDISKRKVFRNPPPPFITSTLQQEAARRHRFPAQKTMKLAQGLYEGKDIGEHEHHGLITYMRTDSPRISKEASLAAQEFIESKFGKSHLPESPPSYKARKGAQEAHEAIRPTSVAWTPEIASRYIHGEELKLYALIWERFVASQMAPAVLNVTTIKLDAGADLEHQFRATGSEIISPGFWDLVGSPLTPSKKQTSGADEKEGSETEDEFSNQILPVLKKDDSLICKKLDPSQHFTKPPPRFSEATLVRELEMQGIGRPSTYAAIMATIRDHDYVTILDRKFQPTELGFLVTEILSENFPEIMSVQFTAEMENHLDGVEEGKELWVDTVRRFYQSFEQRMADAETKIKSLKTEKQIYEGVNCPLCDGTMLLRWGKRGRFLSCAKYPECKGILPYPSTDLDSKKPRIAGTPLRMCCTECGSPMMLKQGRFGLFISCSKFPKCRAKPAKPDGLPCARENCDGKLLIRRGKGRRFFYGCSNYPECSFVLNAVPIIEKCETCGFDYISATLQKKTIQITCPRCKQSALVVNEEGSTHGESDSTLPDASSG